MTKKILAIIGARSGSKTLPHKNIKLFGDKPLLAWPIDTAKQSKYINRIIFSTDSLEYAKLAQKHGAEAPFLRPAHLASDSSIVLDYVIHTLEWLKGKEQYAPDLVVYLSPTTPLVRFSDLDDAIEKLLSDTKSHSIVLVSSAHGHPHKMLQLDSGGQHVTSYMTGKGLDVAPSNRQSYGMALNRESLPVISRLSTIFDFHSQCGETVLFHKIPRETALDIDDQLDFELAEFILNRRSQ
jgi:N-acylneuraminate cytidylyltransferase/CMP-N,N'-diacetyllegionaminic acid synthase